MFLRVWPRTTFYSLLVWREQINECGVGRVLGRLASSVLTYVFPCAMFGAAHMLNEEVMGDSLKATRTVGEQKYERSQL